MSRNITSVLIGLAIGWGRAVVRAAGGAGRVHRRGRRRVGRVPDGAAEGRAVMQVEIVPPDPACDCLGCSAMRGTRKLIEESLEFAKAQIERIVALPYRDDIAIERVKRQHLERADAICRSMSRFLIGCVRPVIIARDDETKGGR